MSVDSIQLPLISTDAPTAMIFGTNDNVNSWIWVADWNIEMPKPTHRLVSNIGAHSFAVTSIVCSAICRTAVSVIVAYSVLVVTRDKRMRDQAPAIDHHEKQELER